MNKMKKTIDRDQLNNRIFHRQFLLFLLIIFSFILLLLQPLQARASQNTEDVRREYQEYRERFEQIEKSSDIEGQGFDLIEKQVFPAVLETFGEVEFIPALDQESSRLALFLADGAGQIVYKTDQLESNNRNRGQLKQPNVGIDAVSFQDLNADGLTDVILIISCVKESGELAGKNYRVGEVLFQSEKGLYRDWRLSDKINRFSMNKSIEFITAFVRDGYSTEFLYTAATQEELLKKGFQIAADQCYWRQFEKLGRLRVVPGTYTMADYHIFMIYLVNEQGYIVWSLQPMGSYDNLYALRGVTCRDIDGDGLKDMVVLAHYSYEGEAGESIVKPDYSVYYQRTGGFVEETEYVGMYECTEETTMEELVKQARAYWGWGTEDDKDTDRR